MKAFKWLLLIFAALFLSLLVLLSILQLESKKQALSFNYPDHGDYLKIDNTASAYYRQTGKGPDVLFIHGIGASQFIWRELESRLQSHYRLTVIDLPGFGRSSKNTLLKLDIESQSQYIAKIIQALDLNPVYIVGSSMGGAIGLWLATHKPDLIKKIAVISPATNPDLVPLPFFKIPQLSYFTSFFINKWSIKSSISRVLTNKQLLTEERILYSLKNFYNHPDSMYCFLLATKTLADPRLPEEFKKTQRDVLILSGLGDQVVKPKYIEELHDLVPNSQLYFHPTGGHHLMEDEPDWVAQHLLTFFENQ